MKARLVNIGYFKGWYFKCSTQDKTIAFIPAYHYNNNKKSASLQIITDDKVFNIPFATLEYCENPLYVKIGNCVFSHEGIILDYKDDGLTLAGKLCFEELSPIRYDIMGPFKYVPYMQCRHSVYSIENPTGISSRFISFPPKIIVIIFCHLLFDLYYYAFAY